MDVAFSGAHPRGSGRGGAFLGVWDQETFMYLCVYVVALCLKYHAESTRPSGPGPNQSASINKPTFSDRHLSSHMSVLAALKVRCERHKTMDIIFTFWGNISKNWQWMKLKKKQKSCTLWAPKKNWVLSVPAEISEQRTRPGSGGCGNQTALKWSEAWTKIRNSAKKMGDRSRRLVCFHFYTPPSCFMLIKHAEFQVLVKLRGKECEPLWARNDSPVILRSIHMRFWGLMAQPY